MPSGKGTQMLPTRFACHTLLVLRITPLLACMGLAVCLSSDAWAQGPAPTATSIASSANPSIVGAAVTFTANVTSRFGFVPDGETVTFYDGSTSIGTSSTSGASAIFTISSLSVGSHGIFASYPGDANYLASGSGVLTQIVSKQTTSTSIGSSNNPSQPGASVTFNAQVNGTIQNVPNGETVTFYDGSSSIGTGTTSGGNGTAQLTTSVLSTGNHSITASYSGDGSSLSSLSNALTQTVSAVSTLTATTVFSNRNPSSPGTFVTFSANVSAQSGGVPNGETVSFYDGSNLLGTGSLNYGGAQITTAALSAGSHTITASYPGDGNYAASISGDLTQTVAKQTTTTTLGSNNDPSIFGNSITFGARVVQGVPDGEIVTFYDGGASIGTGSTNGWNAYFTTPSLSVGSHSIKASYPGDASNLASTSNIVTQIVGKQATTTTVSSNANPSTFGASVTLAAQISGSIQGVPSGVTVTFFDGSTTLGTCSTSGGNAYFTTSALARGSHGITASYPGDASSLGSTSNVLTQVVGVQATTTTISSNDNPSVLGAPVTFNAYVSSQFGSAPNGEPVTFLDGSTTLGTSSTSGGSAYFTAFALAPGSHSITASYPGDSMNLASTSSALSQIVGNQTTSTTLLSSQNPAFYGQSVTFIAQITGSIEPVPDGETMTFYDGSTSIGTGTTSNGFATLSTTALAVGSHNISAKYPGDGSSQGSTSNALAQTINKQPTLSLVTSSVNPAGPGASITFTATFSPAVPNGESVTFYDGSASIGTGLTASGIATLTISSLSSGNHSISAKYPGDSNFSASTSAALVQTVSAVSTSTSTTVSSSYNPSVTGVPVVFTAVVSTLSGTVPNGETVTFYDGSNSIGAGVTSGGNAKFRTAGLGAGTHNITAAYSGDPSYSASTSGALTQVVNTSAIGTATIVSSSQNPSLFGAPVTFNVSVSPPVPNGEIVAFYDGSVWIGAGSTSSSTAQITALALAVGAHSITASYPGDATFAASKSGAVTQTVIKQSTTTAVSSNSNPSIFGQSVTLAAQITGSIRGVPNGETVMFYDGSTLIGASGTNYGTAYLTTTALTLGSHSITASYPGDASSLASTSTVLTQTVASNQATTTTVSSNFNPSIFGQSVTFTAHILTSGPGVPNGEIVTFFDGSTAIGTGGVSYGNAYFATSALAVGIHSITAKYSGDASNLASVSTALTQTVSRQTTTTNISSSANPSVFGASTTLSAHVVGNVQGVPDGDIVTFYDGSASLGTGSTSSGYAYFTTPSLAVGSHSITATYPGDAGNLASTSGALTQIVTKQAPTSTISSNNNPSLPGASVTFTAQINGNISNGEIVTFYDGSSSIGTGSTSGGYAYIATSALAAGSHSMTASYPGDATNLSCTSNVLTQVVSTQTNATVTTVASGTNPSIVGTSVTFYANVSGNVPDGETLTFFDGSTSIGTGSTSGGGAQITISSLAVGNHSITASYPGDGSFAASTSGALTQIVSKQTTTSVLSSNVNPAAFGASVTFSASLFSYVPNGENVTFYDGSTLLGTASLSGGSANFTTYSLALGSHSIKATYPGDSNHLSCTSNVLTQIVGKQATTTALFSNNNPSIWGASVIFTAQLIGNINNLPDGETVTFYDGSTSIGTGLSSNGYANLATSSLGPGAHGITARYPGDAGRLASTSNVLTQTVGKQTTTTSITTNNNPSISGTSVSFTAQIFGYIKGVPDGEIVTFYDGSTSIGTGTTTSGYASFATTSLTLGSHNITAKYPGDATSQASTSNILKEVVGKQSTTAVTSSNNNPSISGASITFTAQIIGSAVGVPNGEIVTFYDGSSTLGTSSTSGGYAYYSTSVLAAGSHNITATYPGDSVSLTCSSNVLIQMVGGQTTSTTIASSPNPAVFGQAVSFTGMVVGSIHGIPNGEIVTFFDGTTSIGTGSTSNGYASLSAPALAAGSHSITATYSGDPNSQASTSSALVQVIGTQATSTTLTSNLNPAQPGASITFNASISTKSGAVKNGETVTFFDGSTSIGTGLTVNGLASLSTSGLNAGTHSITARYPGDISYSASTSNTLNQVVSTQSASTATTVSSSLNPSGFGASVTFSAKVSTKSGFAPSGESVVFYDGSTLIGTCSISNGTAQFRTAALALGSHAITASYLGDANYSASTSGVLTQIISNQIISTATTVSSNPNTSVFGSSVTFNASVSAQSGSVPNGEMVSFYDGSTWIGSGVISNGSVQINSSSLALGSHAITASYPGDGNYSASKSGDLTQTVIKQTTATTVSSNANPSMFGQSVTFAATVSTSGAGVPNGETVTFYDGGMAIGTGGISYGTAYFTTASLSVGPHSITASYPGDASSLASTSKALTQTITKQTTSATISPNTNPSIFGASVVLYAHVIGSINNVPDGETVTFYDGSTSLGTGATSDGNARLTTTALTLGSHTITASYPGDSSNLPATSNVLTEIITQQQTTITVTSTSNPSILGSSVTFGAHVLGSILGVPDGEVVTFYDGSVSIGTATISRGYANLTTPTLTLGSHSITASYPGDSSSLAVTSGVLTQVVGQQTTTTTISSNDNPSLPGALVTFTAQVVGSMENVPDGEILTFYDGSISIGTGSTSGGNGTVQLSTSLLGAGNHSITASYPGDSSSSASVSNTLRQTVSTLSTLTSTSIASGQNPSTLGQSVTFYANVSSNVPDGETVTFFDGSTSIGTGSTSNGQAQFTASLLNAGNHSITAKYAGDANFTTSTSGALTQIVVKQTSTSTITSNMNPSIFGSSVTFDVNVYPNAPGGEIVTFFDGSSSIGTAAISNGNAYFATSALAVGSHNITASYPGDAGNLTSTSNTLTQIVSKQATTTVITTFSNPATPGESVTFYVNVNPGVPNGETITVFDGTSSIGTGTTSGGGAQVSTSSLTIGSHNISASYPGDAVNLASTSNVLIEVVTKQTTTTALTSNYNPSMFGANVTFSVAINPSAPNGETVTFFDGSTSIGTGTTSGGYTYLSTSSLALGSHSITASYPSDAGNTPGTSNVVVQVVGKQTTTSTMYSNNNPSIFGQTVTFTMGINPNVPNGETVTFFDGSTSIGTGTTSGGYASMTTSTLTGGAHNITGSYPGDGDNLPSISNALAQGVSQLATSNTLASSHNPAFYGASVTFTATISPIVPDGEVVTFYDGGTSIGTGIITSGKATLATSTFAAGTHSITSSYPGDSTYSPSTSAALTQTVNKYTTSTTLASSFNASTYGASVTFTATVKPSVPDGETVTFSDGANVIGTGLTSGGKATFTTATFAVGSHSIIASYPGDAGDLASASSALTQVVLVGRPTTTLISSLNPSTVSTSVTFTATISLPVPDGETVKFFEGTTSKALIGTSLTTGGVAKLTTSSLAVGTDTITSEYLGDTNYAYSWSNVLPQIVTPPAGSTYLLWNNAGTASLWHIATTGSLTSASFGPYSGWSPIDLSSDTSGNAYILWANTSGAISIFKVGSTLSLETSQSLGPFSGWAAKSLATSPDGHVHVLWNHTADNEASIYDIVLGSSFTSHAYGPIAGWQAQQIAIDSSDNTRVLWNNLSTNEAALWNITSGGTQTSQSFGPFTGWQAKYLAVGNDDLARMLWEFTSSGESALYKIAPDGSYSSQSFGPYSDWVPMGLAVNNDDDPFVMWDSTSNELSLFDIGPLGSVKTSSYGPFSGWKAIAVAPGP